MPLLKVGELLQIIKLLAYFLDFYAIYLRG